MAMTTKEMEEERNRLQRTNTAQQTQIDKLKRLADDAKGKAESLESELSSVRKVSFINSSSDFYCQSQTPWEVGQVLQVY